MELDITNFGKRLEECMKKGGYNNSKLTQELELSKNAVGNYKNNQIPNATILFEISQKLGVTMEFLLTGENTILLKLSENENEILELLNKLPEREQIKIIGKLEDIAERYKGNEGKSSNSKIG